MLPLCSGVATRTAPRLCGIAFLLALTFAARLGAGAVIAVDTSEPAAATNGNCSLAEAIQAANSDTAVDGCAPGLGADVINLPAGTIDFLAANAAAPGFALPAVTSKLTIQGASAATSILARNALAANIGFLTVSGALTLQRVTLRDGKGALTVEGSATVDDCVFSHDGADGHPAIFASGPLTVKNTTFSGSVLGAIGSYGTVVVDGCLFLATQGDAGHATINGGTSLTIKGSLFDQNIGVGISFAGAGHVLDITDSSFTGQSGETLYLGNHSSTSVTRSTFHDNDNGAFGGVIRIGDDASLTVVDSVFYDNHAGEDGGAIYNLESHALSVSNSTFFHNGAKRGGAIYVQGPGDHTFNNLTIFGNEALDGGGVYYSQLGTLGSLSVSNTILAGNTDTAQDSPDCYAAGGRFLTSKGHNLVGNNVNCAVVAGLEDQIGTGASPIDAKLSALADRGGPTLVLAPFEGSPAIDRGAKSAVGGTACEAKDQRGTPRPVGLACDVGAYEGAVSSSDGGAGGSPADGGAAGGSTEPATAGQGGTPAEGEAGAPSQVPSAGKPSEMPSAGKGAMDLAGAPNGSAEGGSGDVASGSGEAGDDSGCGCRLAGTTAPGGGALLFGVAFILARVWRARARVRCSTRPRPPATPR